MITFFPIFRTFVSLFLSRVYGFIRLLFVSGGKDSRIHPTARVHGRGRVSFGSNLRIAAGVLLQCAKGACLDIGDQCQLGEKLYLIVGPGGALQMNNVIVGRGTRLHIDSEWMLAQGSRIAANCVISSRESVENVGRLILGEGSHIGDNSLIDLSADVVFGAHACVGPSCIIYTHNHRYEEGDRSTWETPIDIGPVTIGDGAWVGARVTILSGVKIGKMAVIAAGAVVVKDVPDYGVYGGIPAKALRVSS